jgi:glycosyltransferase involved in cell wall biosynthesis
MELAKTQMGNVFRDVLIERNIVDFADFRRTSSRTDGTRTIFLYVGKVTVAKGVAFVLECLANLPPHVEFEVDVIGTGDAEEPLRQTYLRDGRFHFHGLCNRQEVVRQYQRASVLLVPSIWFEPAGLVIYQAQVAGLPVVGSDSGGIPELLAGRDDSLVLPAGDHSKWTSSLRALIEDAGMRKQMTEAAMKHASEYQDAIDTGAARVVDFCQSLIVSNPAGIRP